MNRNVVRLAIAAWTRGMRRAQRQYEKDDRGRAVIKLAHPERQRCTKCGQRPGRGAFEVSPLTGATFPKCRSCRAEAREKTIWRQTRDLSARRLIAAASSRRCYYNKRGRAYTQPGHFTENAHRLEELRAKWTHIPRVDLRMSKGQGTCRKVHSAFVPKLDLFEIWDRQDGCCYYSGEPLSCAPNKTHLGHILPVSRGGKTEIPNLCWLSDWANKMQSDQTYDELLARCRLLLAHEIPKP